MAKLKIVIAGAPVLREVAQPVERIDKKLQRLLRDMAETMYAADGVGLAAPQVGVSKRVVVIDVGEGLYELINPEIVKREGKCVDRFCRGIRIPHIRRRGRTLRICGMRIHRQNRSTHAAFRKWSAGYLHSA